ncbi:MAG TPA: hypothetical protein VMA98_11930 [Candidatus Acidoferrales bacterium]|nr:hypothetical protein [Candidatus Acidoferrales bacterium]
MRTYASVALFALALLVAACGGGGKSGVVPAVSNTGGGQPYGKNTSATMRLYVPPVSKQAAHTKPFYISSSTQGFAIYVEPYPSVLPTGLPSPLPTGIQVFPVTTPSPCAVPSGGGETCTFTVTAPIGTDLFLVAALPTATIGPNTVPLSAYVSGPVVVGGSGSPAPLSFTLNGIVWDVALVVPSPDPGNTPNTQLFSAGVAGAAMLPITAYDVNGNEILSSPTTPYLTPIVINASPASEGLTLSLASASSCGSTASGGNASIACSADLSDLQVSYDGTPHPDPSDHLYDSFTVAASSQPSAAPSPAHFVLSSNMLQWTLSPDSYVYSGYLERLSSGAFLYLAYNNSGWVIGTFDPSTSTVTSSGTLNSSGSYYFEGMSVAPNGNLWINNSGPLDCYTSVSSAVGNNPAVITGLYPNAPNGDSIYPTVVTADGSGDIWYVGYDEDTYVAYAGYFTPPSSCATPNPMPSAQFALNGDSLDYDPTVALTTSGNGIVVNSSDNANVYVMNTSTSSGTVNGTVSINGTNGSGVAVDGAGTTYAAFVNLNNESADVETIAAGATSPLVTLLFLPPTPYPGGEIPNPQPSGLLSFSPGGGAADRLMYTDSYFDALGLIESVPASPMPILVSLPNAAYAMQAAYNTNGGEYVLDMDASENLNLVRVLPTTTWSVPNLNLDTACSSPQDALLTILERGDSGPFTISIPAATGVTATQLPGADHDFILSGMTTSTASFTATVTDAHGRNEQFSVNTAQSYVTCGTTHRRLRAKPNQKPLSSRA